MQSRFSSRSLLVGAAFLFGSMTGSHALAQSDSSSAPDKSLITPQMVKDLRELVSQPVVIASVKARNESRNNLSQADIDALDKAWREERGSQGPQPYIAAALGSPVSTYLLRRQAGSKGLYNELFVMDKNGLNVGQSSITSDFWQGDEAKFQKTFPMGAGAVFIDEPEYVSETGTWVVQVNLTLDDNGTPIGSSTIEINLTELQRRSALGL